MHSIKIRLTNNDDNATNTNSLYFPQELWMKEAPDIKLHLIRVFIEKFQ